MFKQGLAAIGVLCLLAAAPQPQQEVTYERYDVDVIVEGDGALLVTETYEIRFEGTFREGFVEIPLDYVQDVTDVRVWDDVQEYSPGEGAPGTFTTQTLRDNLEIVWGFEPTAGTEVRRFSVQYRVIGGLWVYRDRVVLYRDLIPADRGGVAVEAARGTITLPDRAGEIEVTTEGARARVERSTSQTLLVEAAGPIPDGTPLAVRLSLPADLVDAQTPEWQRWGEQPQVRFEAIHVDLTVAPDGLLQVVEQHRLHVAEGTLYTGWREIPWLYLDRITDVQVWEGDRSLVLSDVPGDYHYVVEERSASGTWLRATAGGIQENQGALPDTLIEWAVPAVEPGEVVSFTLRYTVHGALRIVESGQVGAWTAVFSGRDAAVEAATVRLHLPPGIDPAAVTADTEDGSVAVESGETLLFAHDGPVPAHEAWAVAFSLPPGATAARTPAWQHEWETVQADATRRARLQLGALIVGVLLALAGVLGALLAWFVWGRDRPTPLPADYLTDPPSDLPPGIVAYLVDEEPTVKGVLADILHLAALGLISVDLRESDPIVKLNWAEEIGQNQAVNLGDEGEIQLAEHERVLFNAIRETLVKRELDHAPLSQVVGAVRWVLKSVYEQMARQTSAYFTLRPSVARQRWQRVGWLAVGAAGLAAAVLGCLLTTAVGLAALAPAAGLAVAGFAFLAVSPAMPRRTTKGAEEAERWRAYRRYLEDLKDYGDLEAAQRVLDEDFPYAVALGVEQIVLRHAEVMGAQAPLWLIPTSVSVGSAAAQLSRAPRASARRLRRLLASPRRLERMLSQPPPRPRPRLAPGERRQRDVTLDGMSRQLGGSLDSTSRALGGLLDTAAGGSGGESVLSLLGKILEAESSGGGRGGYRARSGGSWRSSSWSRSSRGFSRSRSSGWKSRGGSRSRRSFKGGGGRRGFR